MLILATDMARHGEIMDNFKAKIEMGFDHKDKENLDTVKIMRGCLFPLFENDLLSM